MGRPLGIATGADGATLITDSGRNAVYRYVPPTLPVEVVDDGAATTDGSPASGTGSDGTGGASSDVVLPGGATPAADGGAAGDAGGSFQLTPAAPTNQAPPTLTGSGP